MVTLKIKGNQLTSNGLGFSNATVGNTVGNATAVYVYNANTTLVASLTVSANTGNTTVAGPNTGTISLPVGAWIILRKNPTEQIYCTNGGNPCNNVLFTPVAVSSGD